MVTTVATRHETNDKAEVSFKHVSGWYSYRLVKRCQTLEAAQAVMKQLEDLGQTSQLVMDDGLSVVTQRD